MAVKTILVYYSVILNTKMYFAIFINLFNHMMNLLCYKVIYFRPNISRNFQMAAMKTLFDHLIVPINPNAMMTTYVPSSYSLSYVVFSNILAQLPRHSPQPVEQSNPALRQEQRRVSHPILQLHRTTFSNAFGTTSMFYCTGSSCGPSLDPPFHTCT